MFKIVKENGRDAIEFTGMDLLTTLPIEAVEAIESYEEESGESIESMGFSEHQIYRIYPEQKT